MRLCPVTHQQVVYHNLDLISFGITIDEFATVNIYLHVLYVFIICLDQVRCSDPI